MHFEAGNGLIIPLKGREECEFGIVIDTDKIILLKCREIFLCVKGKQLNTYKLCKEV